MDNMISNAMQRFYQMTKTEAVIEINGRKYKQHGYEAVAEPTVPQLNTHTLQGIVDCCRAEHFEPTDIDCHIYIVSPTQVVLQSEAFGPFLQRHVFIKADAYVTDFQFDRDHDTEEFIIALNSQFQPNEDRINLVKLCSSITKETAGTVTDDGVAQKLEVRSGVSMRNKVAVQNPFTLIPFRTFPEIEQPESDFIFRVKDTGRDIRCALYQADGSKWKITAINRIKAFFKEALPDIPVIA